MKKLFFKLFYIFLFIFGCLFISSKVNAFEFVRATENPLKVDYINGYAYELQHHIFKEDNIYKGIFVINRPPESYYSLGYFESVNGVDFVMKKEILNTGADLSNPSIIKTQTGYLLFISRYDNNTVYRIYSSVCDFDFNCSSNLVPVIIPDTGNNSESNGVFAGHPFVQDSRTFLFFGAWGGDGFKLKLSYSDDLINWQRCSNSFLSGGDGPFPKQENNDLYLFFHQSDGSGIKLAKTTLPLSCDSVFEDQGYLLIRERTYDLHHMIFPSVITVNNDLRLYYSGLGNDSRWRLNLACTGQVCLSGSENPTPTAIPTLTPTPTSTPTPTPIPEKTPIIIIPGFMASWNREAIIHNVDQPQLNWKLNPIVNEYKGIIQTLKNLGYEENKNLFVFAYDWRKPVLNIVEDLNNFITNHPSTEFTLSEVEGLRTSQFSILGHSLGGLVGRIYLQKYNNANVSRLITAGSPHYGVSQFYKIIESGEIDRFNNYLWLAVKLVAALNKNSLETDKQTLNRLFPIMKNLFPVYNFLKKDGNEINFSDMKIKNELLSNESYKPNVSNLTNLTTVVGEKEDTLKGYNIIGQTFFDKLLDNYPDGRPQSSFYEIGDNTVLSSKAGIGTPTILNLDHGELIYKREAIKKILDLLNIQYNDSQIVEGKGTTIDSSLIFLIKSPATMEVVFNGQSYLEQDGIIFIEGAQSGDYQLKVKGVDKGSYEVAIGQIGQNNDVWDSVYGEITASQTDDYNILYNSEAPKGYLETSNNISYLIEELVNYFKSNNNHLWRVTKLMKYKMSWIKHQVIKNRDFIGLEKIENIESKLLSKNHKKVKYSEIEKVEKKINKLKKPINQVVLAEIIKRLDILKKEFINKNYGRCEILIESIEELMKIIKK